MIDFLGLFSLVNVIWAISVFFIFAAICYICATILGPLLINLPPVFYEGVCYLVEVALFKGAKDLLESTPQSNSAMFLALLTCLGVPGLYFLTLALHFESNGNNMESAGKFAAYLCSVVWAYVAVVFDSQLIGFLAVFAFFCAIGFIFLPLPFVYILGFTGKDVIPQSMVTALFFLSVYVYITCTGLATEDGTNTNITYSVVWRVFRPGFLGFGAFVYFLGGLIISNRVYLRGEGKTVDALHYLWTNGVMCISACAAIAIGGVVSELSLLKTVGTTFFILFAIEKYLEMIFMIDNCFWVMLLVGLCGYSFSWYVTEHPEHLLSVGDMFK